MLRAVPWPSTCTGNRPAAHSCTSLAVSATSPVSSAAHAAPTLGWPANGSSWRGVKIRMR